MIEVAGLSKAYGRTQAVNQLSFLVRPGQVTGFLGPNGSGKSTTMRMILGLDSPDSGRAMIDGQRYIDLKHPLRKVGSLLDANWVHPNRTAKAHLRWMARANGLGRNRVTEVLDTVGLASVADKAAGKFSLGMKQRLGIAGALLGDPEVLLFDEPVNGLDPEGIHWIRTFMKSLAAQGRTVLVSSHLLSEMALTADHLVVIGRGRLIADASTQDFIAHSTESSVLVRSPQQRELGTLLQQAISSGEPGARVAFQDDGSLSVVGFAIERIGELAAENRIVLHELSPQTGSLEEAFIQLTSSSVEYNAQDPSAPVVNPAAGQGHDSSGDAGAGYGPQGYGPQGHSPQGYGPQGHSPQGYGPQDYSPQGHSPQDYGPQGYGPPPGTGDSPTGPSQEGR